MRKYFNKQQIRLAKVLLTVIGITSIGVLTMSILGAENFSLHLISLKEGWTGHVWDGLWLGLTSSTFFLLGGACSKLLEVTNQNGN